MHPGDTQETPRRHPRDTQETPRRHPGDTQEAPRSTQEATRKHPGDTQEPPRGTKGSRDDFDVKCAKTIVFYCQKWRDRAFRLDGSDVTRTKSAACAQK